LVYDYAPSTAEKVALIKDMLEDGRLVPARGLHALDDATRALWGRLCLDEEESDLVAYLFERTWIPARFYDAGKRLQAKIDRRRK